ncbi:PLP-dependent cysteine synthase family protein [Granulicella sp. S156]|uniref:PLP-dependent cysteine synthase family protein n=1 Tax=Granulicella sp. S156 TaxID=1747224 RepID=UPI00131A668C|nr:PLP-dependent cysteine synthase family protein [Granulicella sp. S156]
MTPTLTSPAPSFTALPEARLHGISQLIGNTPLLEIELRYKGQPRTIFAKYEPMNLTGSIKDRMVFNIFQQAYADGTLKAGDTIVEATSGNTGISCAAIGRALGHPVKIFMPDWMSRERVLLIQSLGAEVVLLTREQGGFLGSIALCEQLAAERDDIFLPRQFSNQANLQAHFDGTGPEIWQQLNACGRRSDAFVAGVGTGGTVMGTGAFLRQKNPGIKIHPVEPLESPTLSTGHKIGSHRIQGISDDFIPDIIDFTVLDEVLSVSDGDSILMAQKIASELGLGVGISSGCNLIAAIRAQDKLAPSATVVTVFCDDNKKYLTTALLQQEPVKPGYLSSDITLVATHSHPRC